MEETTTKVKYYGVTPPISLKGPTDEEIEQTERMIKYLQDAGQFEDEKAIRNREIVLGQLDKKVQEFVYKASLKAGKSEKEARECRGKIYTFGSYRLGVHGVGGDIDTLCVVPGHVKREDFFSIMQDLLKDTKEVKKMTAVPEAFVPVIKMEYGGVPIDLTFANLQLPTIPEDFSLLNNAILKNIDEQCIRSVNGPRVTDEILQLVPDVKTFRMALKCIKLWAKKRGIYSNSMGFFGGVVWAMLVARVCQLYPNAASGTIVSKFFRIMYQWKWPQPVLLKQLEDGNLGLRVWNPNLYSQDRSHKMPVITPAYPSMCATHNVSQSTYTIMIGEFQRGFKTVDAIFAGTAQWGELYEEIDFFYKYRSYLQIVVSSDCRDTQHKLHGLLESRLRFLVMKIESIENVVLAHPYIESFEHVFSCKGEHNFAQLRHGLFPENLVGQKINIGDNDGDSDDEESVVYVPELQPDEAGGSPNQQERTLLHTSSFFVGILIAEKKPNTTAGVNNGKRVIDLSWPARDFLELIKQTELFNSANMNINIRFFRNYELPSYAFRGSDLRVFISKKKKRPFAQSSANANDGNDDSAENLPKQIKLVNSNPNTTNPISSGGNGDVIGN